MRDFDREIKGALIVIMVFLCIYFVLGVVHFNTKFERLDKRFNDLNLRVMQTRDQIAK